MYKLFTAKQCIHYFQLNNVYIISYLNNIIMDNINYTVDTRRANTCDPVLKLLNEEITSDIHKHNIWKEHLDAHWDHRHNTHILWKTIYGLSNRAHPATLYRSITFNNKIANTPKQFTNTVRHVTHKTNRFIDRETQNIQGYDITLTTTNKTNKRME